MAAAEQADAVVMFMGLSPRLEGEEMNVPVEGFEGGDRVIIGLPAVQQRLIERVHALGKPTVLVLLSGSAVSVTWAAENVPAIVEAWYPGQAAGTAIADVLFGDYNPAGRLPVTFYRSVDQLPPFESYAMKGRTYRYFEGEPPVPVRARPELHDASDTATCSVPASVVAGEGLSVSVDVENTGPRAGEEVVQLYLTDVDADVPVPLRTLAGFTRVSLEPGEKRTRLVRAQPAPALADRPGLESRHRPRDVRGRGGRRAAGCGPRRRRGAVRGDRRGHEGRMSARVDVSSLFSLSGKVALVTGGSSGVGTMIAAGLLGAGARVYIASRKKDACDRVASALSSVGPCFPLPADVATAEGRASLVDALSSREGRLHVLVNNAGTSWGAPYEEYPEAAFEKVLGLNVTAPFALTRDLTPILERAASPDDPARVVNVGSIAGIRAEQLIGTGTFAYSASKAALHHLTRTLAAELGPRSITVNAIAPGFFESRMTVEVLKHRAKEIVAACPLGRIGRPEEMAGVVIYLASRAGAYTNGAVIPVDGGTSV